MCIKVFERKAGLDFKQFQFTKVYFLLHYPTRGLQRSYRLSVNNLPNCFSYSSPFVNKKLYQWSDN